jgi:peptidyl-prolyl cis-trans isomerase B (cyclophilin B)
VAPSKSTEREAREARDRLRRYNARQSVHAHQVTRRRRDNILAIAGVVIVAGLAAVTQVFYFTAGPGAVTASPSASPSAAATPGQNNGPVPDATIAEGRTWTGTMLFNDDAALTFEIDGAAAPQAASAFIYLAQNEFYTDPAPICHRLTTGESAKLIQCGSLNGDGTGDIGWNFGPLENVPTDGTYPAGTIAVARGADPYSQSTQFFITYGDTVLDASTGGYSVIGKVTGGLEQFITEIASQGTADGSEDGAPATDVTITGLSIQ